MRLVSVETTPNPNSMKLNLDGFAGKATTYTADKREGCLPFVDALLSVDGVQSVFVCETFLTINRDPRADWKFLLEKAADVFSDGDVVEPGIEQQRRSAEASGQVNVLVQTFRGIPIQVKVADSDCEKRIALDSRFAEAAQSIQSKIGADYLKERYWADWGVRYGSVEDIAAEVADEIQGAFTAENFDALVSLNVEDAGKGQNQREFKSIADDLASPSWHRRLSAVQELGTLSDPDDRALRGLIHALSDPQHQVRRLAAAALGACGSIDAVEPLCETMLNDDSIAVRRTAGDALSDLGDFAAQQSMCKALKDANKLVRWRAARFLADYGTEEALPSLQSASDDSAFEVQLEIRAAMQRIQGGGEGSLPAWKRIMDLNKGD